MPDPNEKEEKPKTPETTLGNLVHEFRQFAHSVYERLNQFGVELGGMKSAKSTDWPARTIATIALAGVVGIGLVVHWERGDVTQDQEVNVDSPPTDAELMDQRIRDRINLRQQETSDAVDPSAMSGSTSDSE